MSLSCAVGEFVVAGIVHCFEVIVDSVLFRFVYGILIKFKCESKFYNRSLNPFARRRVYPVEGEILCLDLW
jgi:hypothetical protein